MQAETKALLDLQRMEMALVRAVIAHPQFLAEREYRRLRYLFGFARLSHFVPGAALSKSHGVEVAVNQTIVAPLRELLLHALHGPLRKHDQPRERLGRTAELLPALFTALREARPRLIARHAMDFSVEELDAECGRKALVTIMGGGGGAGYVYIGAAARLRSDKLASNYLVGSSIGALIAAFLARSRAVDIEGLLAWAKGLSMRQMFSRPFVGATHTLPGLLRLHLKGMHKIMRNADGSPMRLSDLEIPYEAVVSGLRAKVYDHLPAAARALLAAPASGKSFSRLLAERVLALTAFADPHIVQPIVLGRDAATRKVRVVDAVGLSAAIPGVLQYEPPKRDEQTDEILMALRREHDCALFVDGAMASNVPARIAWQGVQEGRIGTRNAFFLALDCFHPQWDSQHLWLGPVQQIIQLQLRSQRPYFDWILRFSPTLSPINLLPNAAQFEQAYQWGWQQADVMMPFLYKALEPVAWQP